MIKLFFINFFSKKGTEYKLVNDEEQGGSVFVNNLR
jgi:hypothetical protein